MIYQPIFFSVVALELRQSYDDRRVILKDIAKTYQFANAAKQSIISFHNMTFSYTSLMPLSNRLSVVRLLSISWKIVMLYIVSELLPIIPCSVLILASDWLTTVKYGAVSHVWRHQRYVFNVWRHRWRHNGDRDRACCNSAWRYWFIVRGTLYGIQRTSCKCWHRHTMPSSVNYCAWEQYHANAAICREAVMIKLHRLQPQILSRIVKNIHYWQDETIRRIYRRWNRREEAKICPHGYH